MPFRTRGRAFVSEGAVRPATRPGQQPFASFFEREQHRQERSRTTRRVVIASVVVHVLVFGGLVAWSYWDVDELFGPSVEVKVYGPKPTGNVSTER